MIEKIFVTQGIRRIELEEFLKKELEKAGFTGVDIIKTPIVTKVVINVVKPGLAIGRSGQTIKNLTEIMEKQFGIENPQIEIRGIEKPDLDAEAVVNKIKSLIERGFSWRSVIYKVLNDIVDAGAEGVEIIIKGKLTGKGGRKKKIRIIYGYMKKVGDQVKLVDYGKTDAYTKAGAIGIRVRIVRPNTVFPDKINIKEYLLQRGKIKESATTIEEVIEKGEENKVKEETEKATEKQNEEKKEKRTRQKKKQKEDKKLKEGENEKSNEA
ncbi:MAG: 30S ribosomal protein S3 [Candidatus Diapherotrites archaeon]|nr:30S ribosomal protein S3 [Candidatus Diapherotrites archaeon]